MELVAICVVLGGILILALLAKVVMCYKNKQQRIEAEKYAYKVKCAILPTKYEQYKVIARRTSVPNTPARVSGDFMDFISPRTHAAQKGWLETRLSSANCGKEIN